jgi:hypothetical protein
MADQILFLSNKVEVPPVALPTRNSATESAAALPGTFAWGAMKKVSHLLRGHNT